MDLIACCCCSLVRTGREEAVRRKMVVSSRYIMHSAFHDVSYFLKKEIKMTELPAKLTEFLTSTYSSPEPAFGTAIGVTPAATALLDALIHREATHAKKGIIPYLRHSHVFCLKRASPNPRIQARVIGLLKCLCANLNARFMMRLVYSRSVALHVLQFLKDHQYQVLGPK
mgnify:CR=1 FL=1